MSGALATLHQDLQDLVGQTVAERYRIDALLGVGGMAAVFRAHHQGLDRDIALKVLHPDLSSNEEMSARFEREARSASRLDHPNCVQVMDFGSTEAGMKFLAMQLLEGGELTSMLGAKISPPRAVGLILQVLRGLDHAHKNGVVHRDIKPENVFVTEDHDGAEVLKLVDFGIAKLTGSGDEKHKTTAGLVFGTPAYMSPEQAMGVETDSRSDLYSVGVLFYQMLAGRLPIDNEDPVALVRMQVSVDPDPLPASVPPVVAGVVERLLAKDRDARFSSTSEVVQMLENIEPMLTDAQVSDVHLQVPVTGSTRISIETAPIVVNPTGPLTPQPVPRKWLVPGIAVLGAVIAVAVGVTLFSADDDGAEVTQTRTAVAGDSEVEPVDTVREGVSKGQIDEIDQLLVANKPDAAAALILKHRDVYPDDPQLLWRNGKAFVGQAERLSKAKDRVRKRASALRAYGEAVEADPSLIDDKVFYAELHDLMRDSKLRAEALDVALQQLGDSGHKFLVEIVNEDRNPLQYDNRHRALDVLADDEENGALVDVQLNRALDIMQAAESSMPCKSYSDALAIVEAEPDFFFHNRVDKAKVPEEPADAGAPTQDDVGKCPELPARREALLARLAELDPEAEAEDVVVEDDDPDDPSDAGANKGTSDGAAAKPKKRKRDSDCSKFLGGLKKKCRR